MDDNQSDLPPGAKRITRDQYVELLVDGFLQEAAEMEEGFTAWCAAHVPTWRQMGRDEQWIRQRIESAQSTRRLHETMRARGLTIEQRRQVLRQMYACAPELYDLLLERERDAPQFSIIYGTPDDLLQRYVLRILVYEADKAAHAGFCRWAGIPEEKFQEDPDQAFIRDFSTVEDLELALQMVHHAAELFATSKRLPAAAIGARMEALGRQLRDAFIAQYGYPPEASTTPRIPVTLEGPVDPETYRRQHGLA